MSYNRYAVLEALDLETDTSTDTNDDATSQNMEESSDDGLQERADCTGSELASVTYSYSDDYDYDYFVFAEGPQAYPPPGHNEYNYIVSCVKDVLDHTVLASNLKAILVVDLEWAQEYIDGQVKENGKPMTKQQLTELGITVTSLSLLRTKTQTKTTISIQDILECTRTANLRILETAKYQLRWGRRGESLWNAAWLVRGKSWWVHKRNIAGDFKRAAIRLLKEMDPNASETPEVVLIAHDSSKEVAEFRNAGIDVDGMFDIVESIDSQQLSRVWMTNHPSGKPGLAALCAQLGIDNAASHNGGNDTYYTTGMMWSIILDHASHQNVLPVEGEPVSEVGDVMRSLWNEALEPTKTTLIALRDVCDHCGIQGHDAEDCKRRCGYCSAKWSGHTFRTCPVRQADLQANPGMDQGFHLRPSHLPIGQRTFQGRRQDAMVLLNFVKTKVSQRERKEAQRERKEAQRLKTSSY